MKDSSKIKPFRPAPPKSVDPVTEVTAFRPSTADKLRLKSQLEEECFSVPMEAEIPIYRWYVNTLPKDEEIDFSEMFPTDYCPTQRDEMVFKEEPLDDDVIPNLPPSSPYPVKDEPMDDYIDDQMLGEDEDVNTENVMIGEDREKDTTIRELARENEALKTEMAEMRKEHEERIDELTQKAAQYKKAAAVRRPKVVGGLVLHEDGDPHNILKLCDSNSSEATSFETALRKIFSVVKAYERFNSSGRHIVGFGFGDGWLADVFHENFAHRLRVTCECCQKTFINSLIIHHVVSKRHGNKVRSLGAAVSTAALEYWLDMLKPTAAVMKRLQQKQQEKKSSNQIQELMRKHSGSHQPTQQQPISDSQPTAAAAADPAASEDPSGIDEEEIDG